MKHVAHNQDNLRKKLVESARDVIAEKGLPALNVREIAKRAECAVGMVYKVLKGIDDIIIHVNARTLDDLHTLLKEAKADDGSPETIVNKLAYAYIHYHKANPHFWSALFEYQYNEEFEHPSFYVKKLDAIFSTIEDSLLPVLNENAEKANITAKTLWAGVHGICALSLCGALNTVKIQSEKELIDTLVFSCLAGAKQEGG